jgi:VIT1/CCC1 family predicted Fe2+/Mn2+ transporter
MDYCVEDSYCSEDSSNLKLLIIIIVLAVLLLAFIGVILADYIKRRKKNKKLKD